MVKALLLILHVIVWPTVPAMFTVEVAKPTYEAEFRGDVTMACRFPPTGEYSNLSVIWSRIRPKPDLEVYRLENGLENHNYQYAQFSGRARLQKEELKRGEAVLHVSNLKINDSGTYQCLVNMGGADYVHTTLTVRASYKPVKKSIRNIGNDMVELSCESCGYPLASVVWTDGKHNVTMDSNVTSVMTPDQLFNITSRVTVKRFDNNNYTCSFVTEGLVSQTARFDIPDEISERSNNSKALRIASSISFITFMGIVVAVFLYRRKRGRECPTTPSAMKLLLEGHALDTAAACLSPEANNKVQTCSSSSEVFDEKVETLRAALREQYTVLLTNEEVSGRLASFCDKVLPQALHTRDGQSQNIHALLPDTRETLLLEGTPGSGKTNVAQSLASSWAQSWDRDPFGARQLQLVLLVDCAGATSDLFQVAMSHIQKDADLGADDLRAVLTGPVEGLLILDGYREGNEEMDESLQRFLRDRQTCRVLITACLDQCCSLGESINKVLMLHHRPAEG